MPLRVFILSLNVQGGNNCKNKWNKKPKIPTETQKNAYL